MYIRESLKQSKLAFRTFPVLSYFAAISPNHYNELIIGPIGSIIYADLYGSIKIKGGVHISKFANGDLTWENQSVSKYHALWYVILTY